MARTSVPVTKTSRLQVFPTFSADVVDGDTVEGMRMSNNGATWLHVVSGSGSDETVELIILETVDFSTPAPIVLTIPANVFAANLGPFPVNVYGNVLEFNVSSNSLGFLAFSLI